MLPGAAVVTVLVSMVKSGGTAVLVGRAGGMVMFGFAAGGGIAGGAAAAGVGTNGAMLGFVGRGTSGVAGGPPVAPISE